VEFIVQFEPGMRVGLGMIHTDEMQ
jgi:hypothetical protein